MAENEFERKVSGLMEEFKVSPSQAVWSNVEKEIRQKRRRKILAWIIPACLLLAVGGGYFFVQQYKPSNTIKSTTGSGEPSSVLAKENKANEPSGKKAELKTAVADTINTISVQSQKLDHETGPVQMVFSKTKGNNSLTEKDLSLTRERAQEFVSAVSSLPEAEKLQNHAADKVSPQKTSEVSQQLTWGNNDSINTINNISAAGSGTLKTDSTKSIEQITPKMTAAVPVNKSELQKSSKNKSKFQWGVDAFYGRSDVVQGIFSGIFDGTQDKAAMQDNPGGGLSSGGQLPQSYIINPPKAGASMRIGIIGRKDISSRSSVSVALNYSSQKTTINTGNRVDSSRLFYNAVAPSFASDFYRIASDSTGSSTYNNHYQFIQVPVIFNYRFNNSRKVPLYFNSGIAASVLINSKSLIYDPTYAAFYSDNTIYKKLQLNFIAGISGKVRLNNSYFIIGPQLQYSLTNLAKNKDYFGKQHLFNYGVHASFFLNKK